jgi:hypothetical protein
MSTPHGSRLYGLAHAGSDFDQFDVVGWDKGKGVQKIKSALDLTVTPYERFMRYCDKGVPQFLEAMFSQQMTFNSIEHITATYTPSMAVVRGVYLRTIKNFWMAGIEENSYKKRRHALRLGINLNEMERSGRFNPTLSAQDKAWISSLAWGVGPLPDIL